MRCHTNDNNTDWFRLIDRECVKRVVETHTQLREQYSFHTKSDASFSDAAVMTTYSGTPQYCYYVRTLRLLLLKSASFC